MTKDLDFMMANKLCAIVRGIKFEYIPKLADALIAGGIKMIEVTFDQKSKEAREDALKSIKYLNENYEGKLLVGAGTVMSEEQAQEAFDAGARFVLSPNTDEKVIRKTKALGIISIPGAMTPSEIAFAYNCGADIVKLFPAGIMGPSYVKAVRGPINHVPLMGVGGINLDNIQDIYKSGCCSFGIGGNLAKVDWVVNDEFDKITSVASDYVKKLNEVLE